MGKARWRLGGITNTIPSLIIIGILLQINGFFDLSRCLHRWRGSSCRNINGRPRSLPHSAQYCVGALPSDQAQVAYSFPACLSPNALAPVKTRVLKTFLLAIQVFTLIKFRNLDCINVFDGITFFDSCFRTDDEFFLSLETTVGSVCIKINTQELPGNCMLGTRLNSIGTIKPGNIF